MEIQEEMVFVESSNLSEQEIPSHTVCH